MVLYTGKGDDGTSALFNSKKRISKDDLVFEALGSLDELNSYMGVCKANALGLKVSGEKITDIVERVQDDLFTIQASIAQAPPKISKNRINWLELRIEKIEKELPKINSFIIPGGDELSAQFDYARTLARKAERRVVAVKDLVTDNTLTYLNRLSSLLYALARYINSIMDKPIKSPTYQD